VDNTDGAHVQAFCAIPSPAPWLVKQNIGIQRAAWLRTCVDKVPPEALNARLEDSYKGQWAIPFLWVSSMRQSSSASSRFLMLPKSGSESIRVALFGGKFNQVEDKEKLQPANMWWRDYCSRYGIAFASEPLKHFLGGYAETASWEGDSACYPEQFEMDAQEWPTLRPRKDFNEHRAPIMWYIRNAAKHFKTSGASEFCPDNLISYLGHMSSHSAVHDWNELKTVMRSVHLQPIEEDLEHVQRPNEMHCKSLLNKYAHAETLPPSIAAPICEDLLEDYVCLGYNLPSACKHDAQLQDKFQSMKAIVESYHGEPAPEFEGA